MHGQHINMHGEEIIPGQIQEKPDRMIPEVRQESNTQR